MPAQRTKGVGGVARSTLGPSGFGSRRRAGAMTAFAVFCIVALLPSASAVGPTVVKQWHAPYTGPFIVTTKPFVTFNCVTTSQTPMTWSQTSGHFGYTGKGTASSCSNNQTDSSFLSRPFQAGILPSFTGVSGTHLIEVKWSLTFKIFASLTGSTKHCGNTTYAAAYLYIAALYYNDSKSTGVYAGITHNQWKVSLADSTGTHTDSVNRSIILKLTENFSASSKYTVAWDENLEVEGLVINNATTACTAQSSLVPLTGGGNLGTVDWARIV